MLFIDFILLFTPAVFALGIVERTPADVLVKLQAVDADTQNLTRMANIYDGTKAGFDRVFQACNKLAVDIRSANKTLFDESAYSCTDSNRTNEYISGPLEPDTLVSMNALVAIKRQLNDRSPIVAWLYSFRQGYQGFFKTYATKVCAAAAKNESVLAKKIDGDISNAIYQYNQA